MNKWYVLQVMSGKELEVLNELKRRNVKALVPVENRVIRQRGKWTQKEYILFAGYVFVEISYSWGQYYTLSGINGIIKILGGGNAPTALTTDEVSRIKLLNKLLATPSVVRFNGENIEPLNGVLREFKDCITSVKRRFKRATLAISIADERKEITVSFIEQTQEKSEG